jgi:hypothetical protein
VKTAPGLGLPPATTDEQRYQYVDIAREYDEAVDQPSLLSLNKVLDALGVGPVSVPLSIRSLNSPTPFAVVSAALRISA